MTSRQDLVAHLWNEIINPLENPSVFDNIVANCKRAPGAAFAEAGPAIERMRAAGIDPADLSIVCRSIAYESVFGTLYAIGDPGVENDDVFGLYEDMLTSPAART